MKKILAVIPSLCMGGAEKAFILWVEELKSLGFDVIVATTQPDEDFFSLNKDTLRFKKNSFFHRNKILSFISRFWEPFSNASFLKKIIKENDIDIVISHLPKSNIPSIMACQSEKIPCLIMEHSYQKKLKDPILNFLRKKLYSKASALIVLTPAMKDLFSSFNSNIIQIANPIPLPSFIFPFEEKDPIILLVGRLVAVKQYKEFIDNLYQLSLGFWKIWIVGEGEERTAIEESIFKNSLQDKIVLWGAQSNVDSFYQKASIFVLCSEREGFSLVLAEAALHGCSRVSFNCPTGPEIMIEDSQTGFLVENQNWSILMEKLQFLIDNEEVRKKFYQNSLIPQDEFNSKIVTIKWQSLIERFI